MLSGGRFGTRRLLFGGHLQHLCVVGCPSFPTEPGLLVREGVGEVSMSIWRCLSASMYGQRLGTQLHNASRRLCVHNLSSGGVCVTAPSLALFRLCCGGRAPGLLRASLYFMAWCWAVMAGFTQYCFRSSFSTVLAAGLVCMPTGRRTGLGSVSSLFLLALISADGLHTQCSRLHSFPSVFWLVLGCCAAQNFYRPRSQSVSHHLSRFCVLFLRHNTRLLSPLCRALLLFMPFIHSFLLLLICTTSDDAVQLFLVLSFCLSFVCWSVPILGPSGMYRALNAQL